jgi:hypothetical protein
MNHLTNQVRHTARVHMALTSAWRYLTACLAFIAMLLVFAPGAWAQDNATITGTVADSTGAVVPNTDLTLTNTATNQIRHSVTNTSGIYHFANVGVGHYTLTVTAAGFEKYIKTDIVVNVAQSLSADVVLTVGSQGQTVTVAADALQVQTETNELSFLISGQQVTQLATNGRNVTALAALGMGKSNTLSDFGGVNALTSSNTISFNGTRSSHNIYLLDGGELNDRGCGGCFSSLPSMDSLAEFQTLDSNYSADYGIGSGGTILMVIKSGTHKYHGSAWEFNRNEDYGANNYFTKRAGQARPKFRLNEPGANIGGPLWIPHVYNNARNRTFFFWNEEWRRLIQGSSPTTLNTIMASNFATANADLNYTVPSNGKVPVVPDTTDPDKLALYKADGLTIGQPFPNNRIPANLMDSNALLELNAGTFPKPNLGTSQYISSIPQPTNVREDLVRIDHAINSKFQLMGHYLHDDVKQSYFPPLWGDSSWYPTVGNTMTNPSYSSVIKLTQTYSPSLLNETAFLYSGNTIHLSPTGVYAQPSGWSATTFFPSANNFLSRMPEVDLGAPYSTGWSSNYFPWKNSYEGYQGRDDVSWMKGHHQFKFGFSYLHTVKNQELQANTQGTAKFNDSSFSGDSYIDFIMGNTASFTQLEYLSGKHWVNNNYSVYAVDNWHMTPKLTVNLGYRFDAMPHAFERYDKFANFVPSSYLATQKAEFNLDGSLNTAGPGFQTVNGTSYYLNGIKQAGVDGFPRGVVHNNYGTSQPRIGFAYDLHGNGKTVIRGGVGIFFERVQGNDVYNAALNPPFAFQPSANNVSFSNTNKNAKTGVVSAGGSIFPSTLTNLDYSFKSPGASMFSLGIQRELAPSIIAVVQYVGSTGWHQSADRSINTLPLLNSLNSWSDRKAVAGGASANQYRQYPGFSTITQEQNTTNSDYNSAQAGVRVENRHGLTVQVAYTYSHEIDIVSSDLNSLGNPFDPKYNRGSGGFDRRHIFNANYIYNLPFFAKGSNGIAHSTLGGWQFSGIVIAQSGIPVEVTYGSDVLGLGGGTTNRPDVSGKAKYPKKKVGSWFDTSIFSAPKAVWDGGSNQGFGTGRKDTIVGPGRLNFNMSLFKSIPLTSHEGPRIELRFESFNTFNHTQLSGLDSGFTDSNFGQATSASDPRNMQLGGKFIF